MILPWYINQTQVAIIKIVPNGSFKVKKNSLLACSKWNKIIRPDKYLKPNKFILFYLLLNKPINSSVSINSTSFELAKIHLISLVQKLLTYRTSQHFVNYRIISFNLAKYYYSQPQTNKNSFCSFSNYNQG